MGLNTKTIREVSVELLRTASIRLPPDVKASLKAAYRKETSPAGKIELKNILDNFESAEKLCKPVCQDTGMVSFYIKSRDLTKFKEVQDALITATIEATKNVPLRPNAVHPITRKNSGNNVGEHIPNIQWVYGDVDYFELTAFVKGGGSENMSTLAMLTPDVGVKGIKKFVVESVVKAGGKPCPPIILGIGIGGTVDLTYKLAKLALLRPIGSRHTDGSIAKLETELLELVNKTGIGPMGLGGEVTALDVKAEYAHCHTTSLPVGVNMQCWADRKASARIHPDNRVEYLT